MTGNTITVKADFTNCTKVSSLLQLEQYKKTFQGFWVGMVEQFVPATTIFVSGEKWCNNDQFICTQFEESDYDFEYVNSQITIINYGSSTPKVKINTGTTVSGGVNVGNTGGVTTTTNTGGTPYGRPTIFSPGTTVLSLPKPNNQWITIANSQPTSNTNPTWLSQYQSKIINLQPQNIFY